MASRPPLKSAPNGAPGSAPINKNPWSGSALQQARAPYIKDVGNLQYPKKNPWGKLSTDADSQAPTPKQI